MLILLMMMMMMICHSTRKKYKKAKEAGKSMYWPQPTTSVRTHSMKGCKKETCSK